VLRSEIHASASLEQEANTLEAIKSGLGVGICLSSARAQTTHTQEFTSVWPFRLAQCSGVRAVADESVALTTAPRSNKSQICPKLPVLAARRSAIT
jgi:hypothetical protein